MTPQQIEAIEAFAKAGTKQGAADLLGISRGALRSRLAGCALRSEYAEDLRDDIEGRVVEGFELKGYSQFTKTATGDPIWLKTRRAERDYWQGLQAAVERIQPITIDTLPFPQQPQSDIIGIM